MEDKQCKGTGHICYQIKGLVYGAQIHKFDLNRFTILFYMATYQSSKLLDTSNHRYVLRHQPIEVNIAAFNLADNALSFHIQHDICFS